MKNYESNINNMIKIQKRNWLIELISEIVYTENRKFISSFIDLFNIHIMYI